VGRNRFVTPLFRPLLSFFSTKILNSSIVPFPRNLKVELDNLHRSTTDADLLPATHSQNRRDEVLVTPRQKTCAIKSSAKPTGLTRAMTIAAYITTHPHPEAPHRTRVLLPQADSELCGATLLEQLCNACPDFYDDLKGSTLLEGESFNSGLTFTLTSSTGLRTPYCKCERLRTESTRANQGKRNGILKTGSKGKYHLVEDRSPDRLELLSTEAT